MSKVKYAARIVGRTLLLAAWVGAPWIPQAFALESAATMRIAPNALLSIDQNRATVVDRIVAEWGDALTQSRSGITVEQLREMLLGMRSDYLLAASVAGSLEGLRQVVSSSLIGSPPKSASDSAKALGDAADDLVYTPVVPCRIVDTRNAGGPLAANETRNYHAYLTSGTFASQGGASSNCGIPANPGAVALNITIVSASGAGFLTAWPFNTSRPLASTLNFNAPGEITANGAIVPICQPSCANEFSVYTSGSLDLIIDIVGYFAAPIATALQCSQVNSASTTIAVSTDTMVALPSCASGYTRTGANCFGTANIAAGYVVETNANGCVFRNLSSVATYNGTATSICCRVPGR